MSVSWNYKECGGTWEIYVKGINKCNRLSDE